jgi:nucleolin
MFVLSITPSLTSSLSSTPPSLQPTPNNRGFGFVTFANKDEAQLAIDALNETELDGRTIRVNFAQPRDPNAPRPPRRSYRGRGRGRGFRGGRGRGEGGGEGGGAPES